jgi:hypothetical protein
MPGMLRVNIWGAIAGTLTYLFVFLHCRHFCADPPYLQQRQRLEKGTVLARCLCTCVAFG